MTFEEYQGLAQRTALYPDIGRNFVYPTLGLAGEAGELANKIKKIFRDDGGIVTPERVGDIKHELGDVLWYIAQLSTELGIKLDDVAQQNIDTLAKRLDKGTLHGSGDHR